MTILTALRGGLPRANIEAPGVPLTSSVLLNALGLSGGKSGVSVTEKTALGVPAAWRAVSLIASTAATLPLHAFEAQGDARVRVTSGSAASLLDTPHPDLTPVELLELVFVALLLWGNAYLLCLRDQMGVVRELWWVAPSRVRADRDDDGRKSYVIDGNMDLPARDVHLGGSMLHIPALGYDGVVGASPIRVAREAFGMALAGEEYGARLFGSGGLATGVLSTEQRLTPSEASAIKALWKAGGTGLDSAHDIRVVGSGAKFEQLSIPPVDAQFIESRRFQITEIARIFGVPPHMLGETEKATSWGTGIEQQNIGFVTYTLRPWLSRVEQRLSRVLAPGPVYARFSVEGLLRGDSSQRAAFYRQLWEVGALSTNDILALEERGPVDGGDSRYVPLNFGPLTQVDVEDSAEASDGSAIEVGPSTDSEAKAAEAARYLQQIYLAVGKVVTVAEARSIVEQASGVTLGDRDPAEIFGDLPPLPAPAASATVDGAGTTVDQGAAADA
jgi:HK97 family phage portal protein